MSDRATECPHCGCPIEISRYRKDEKQVSLNHKSYKRSKYIVGCLIAIIVLAVAAFLIVKNEAIFAPEVLKITPEFAKALERYDQVDAFSEGMAAVRRDGKWGYINLKGEEVIPCQFSDAFPPGQFSEGLACVVDERSDADKKLWNKRVGFINKKGEWVITGDYFTDSPTVSSVWEEDSHKLPSFKNGKCAVWNTAVFSLDGDTESGWSKEYEANKIVLIDKNGKSEEVADSLGYKMLYYRPYNVIAPNKDIAKCQEKKVVYDDYAITIARDTTECDNGARLVTWQILDANDYPYHTEEKTVQYFIDKQGNSTLSPAQTEAMEQHLNGLVAHLADQHNEQLLEEQRRQWEEERRQQREWLYGTWEYNGTIDMGVYLGGVKRVTSKLVITEDNITVYDNGSLEYNGSYEIEGDRIVYDRHNGYAMILPFDIVTHEISFDKGKSYSKTSSATSNYSSNYNSYSNSTSSTTFRTVADVWAYLSDHTFTGNGTSFRISERYISINGTPATGGVRVSNIRATSATLSASSPYLGGQQIILYLNAANGTIISDGLTYYAH